MTPLDEPALPGWDEALERARAWTPDTPSRVPWSGCPLCVHDRAALGGSPVFEGLPHSVVHPLVFALDLEITAEVDEAFEAEEERLRMRPNDAAPSMMTEHGPAPASKPLSRIALLPASGAH